MMEQADLVDELRGAPHRISGVADPPTRFAGPNPNPRFPGPDIKKGGFQPPGSIGGFKLLDRYGAPSPAANAWNHGGLA